MKKKLLLIFVLLILLFASLASAEEVVYKKGQLVDLTVNCINNGTICSGSATCNMTITHPNSSIIVDNELMTNNDAYHNYTLANSDTLGVYRSFVLCCDSGLCYYTSFDFEITNTGSEKVNNLLSIIITSFIMILFFTAMGIITTHESRLASMTRWGSISLAFLQLILLLSFIYGAEVGIDFSLLLRINFMFTGIIGFGLFFLTGWLKMVELANVEGTKATQDKWDVEKKW